ncbi:MAG: TIGR04086 family membrane protein [Clostridia bacterium]|nr:TIGR04086 family membrane protein [Clostridia bacterium]
MIFAFVIKWANIPDSAITPVNLVIKAFSVFLGSIFLTKNGTKGLINGVLFALIYTMLSFTTFSLLAGEFVLGMGLVSDFAFNTIAGAIGGIMGANLKK